MEKRVLKIFAILLVLTLIILQFLPVNRENPPVDKKLDLLSTEDFSADSKDLLKAACYDCHSNETKYPWYSYVAPVSFFVEHHILEGREELNFSEFQSYSTRKKDHKLEEVIDALKKGWMPLSSYVAMHSEANLTQEQREKLVVEFAQLRKKVNLNP